MKVYVTKYALTMGIVAINVEPSSGDERYVYPLPGQPVGRWSGLRLDRDAHEDYAAAVKAAEAARDKKVKSLKAQAAKLQKLTFPEQPATDPIPSQGTEPTTERN